MPLCSTHMPSGPSGAACGTPQSCGSFPWEGAGWSQQGQAQPKFTPSAPQFCPFGTLMLIPCRFRSRGVPLEYRCGGQRVGRVVLATTAEDGSDRELQPETTREVSKTSETISKVTGELPMPSAPHRCRNIEVHRPQAPSPALNKKVFLPRHELSHRQEAAPWTGRSHHEPLRVFIRNKQCIHRMVTALRSPLKP